ncbi:hypothetical protein BLOT_003701 [Blomia tropicalis]|nr:hypothetical protein BLOT_003701 [Blomia tropicalis]
MIITKLNIILLCMIVQVFGYDWLDFLYILIDSLNRKVETGQIGLQIALQDLRKASPNRSYVPTMLLYLSFERNVLRFLHIATILPLLIMSNITLTSIKHVRIDVPIHNIMVMNIDIETVPMIGINCRYAINATTKIVTIRMTNVVQ